MRKREHAFTPWAKRRDKTSACRWKVKYATAAAARKTARALNRRRGDDCRPYKCQTCDGFHLTSLR